MENAKKNRCPERAAKRAVSDARCALRKLGQLQALAALIYSDDEPEEVIDQLEQSREVLGNLASVLNLTPEDK